MLAGLCLFGLAAQDTHANSLSGTALINPDSKSDEAVCKFATVLPAWRTEVMRRGLVCDESGQLVSPSRTEQAQNPAATPPPSGDAADAEQPSQNLAITAPPATAKPAGGTLASEKPATPASPIAELARSMSESELCRMATDSQGQMRRSKAFMAFVDEAASRGIDCGALDDTAAQAVAAATPAPAETESATQQQAAAPVVPVTPVAPAAVTGNTQSDIAETPVAEAEPVVPAEITNPEITIVSADSAGPKGMITGTVTDSIGIAELLVDGQLVQIGDDGSFTAQAYVPRGGATVVIEAVNLRGGTSRQDIRLERKTVSRTAAIKFDRLNPLGRSAVANDNALALIIGVESYSETPIKAAYANTDAQVFADYATQKLGIRPDHIRTLVDEGADEKGILLTVKDWLNRAIRPGQSDIFIFFAGHGLASDDGEEMYLLPYDGSPRLLERTAVLRRELFIDIAAANPRSVTVFLDTCYSGTTRGTESLIASRPIAIRAREQSIPSGFTVMTAAAGDQTAKPLEEARHGMFSYFLMKGMEGDADANEDDRITVGELHAYVQQNVIQQSSGSQTPELQGDPDRVLVRFQ